MHLALGKLPNKGIGISCLHKQKFHDYFVMIYRYLTVFQPSFLHYFSLLFEIIMYQFNRL